MSSCFPVRHPASALLLAGPAEVGDGTGEHVLNQQPLGSPVVTQVVEEADDGDHVPPRVIGGAGGLLPPGGEPLGRAGAEGEQVDLAVRQCATSATAGPVQAACQSTTPQSLPRRHRTLPGWKSPCTSTCASAGAAPWLISAARSHTLGCLAQAGGW
jgi:hypothetical protein